MTLSPEQIRTEGLIALRERLGVDGMIRFLHQFDPGFGDYTKARRKWVETTSLDDLVRQIKSDRRVRENSYHVEPHERGWAVRAGSATRPTSVHATRQEAVAAARRRAKRRQVEVVIHHANGTVDHPAARATPRKRNS